MTINIYLYFVWFLYRKLRLHWSVLFHASTMEVLWVQKVIVFRRFPKIIMSLLRFLIVILKVRYTLSTESANQS